MPTSIIILSLLAILGLRDSYLLAQEEPRSYISYRTDEIITVDGLANEKAWQKAEWSSDFIDIEGERIPKYSTKVKMIWDDIHLHFYAEMQEPHLWGTLKERDTVIFYNNDFEIFIDPDGDTHNYMEFEMNVLNTVWDLILTKPYRNQGNILDFWDMKGLKSAVHMNGTLNDAGDTDKGWSVEISIPWKVMAEGYHGTIPPKDEFWRINFSRVNWQFDLEENHYVRKRKTDGTFEPEYNWVWSPQHVINMHEPERWGYVYFSTDNASNQKFSIPDDEYLKWYMYEVYRKVRENKGDFEGNPSPPKIIKGKPIEIKYDKHLVGFTIYTKSPFSGNLLTIDADGKFDSHEQ
ncbi:carbohydrate-binding family 9-like protein [Maribacter sp. X9]|uniref:carbohydrate-binding family 9-like protein n=1 Tax=Maribacter sp. X9 TaxID=3402159 RepID=UPI003AF36B88